MKSKLQKGWWLAVSGLSLIFAIQAMLIRESYQYEKLVFIEKMEKWMDKSLADLSFKSYQVPKNSQDAFSIGFEKALVHCVKDGVLHKFKYDKNTDNEKIRYQVMYDYRDAGVWRLTRLDSLFQQKTKELGFSVPIEYALEDSVGNEVNHYAKANLSWLWRVKVDPIKLGFVDPHILRVSYEFPFGYYWAVAFDRLLMAGIFFVFLVFCVYWLFRTIVIERRNTKNQDKFVHSLVHNLKNPVVSCMVGLEQLKIEHSSEKERRKNVAAMFDLKQKMGMLKYDIEDLLLTDASANGFHLRLREFDFVVLLQEVVAFYKNMDIPNKKVVLDVIYDRTVDYKIVADRGHLLGVLSNLIDNSIKYSGKEVEIEFLLFRRKHHLEISVKDNGSGILEEDLKHMFETGYRGVSPIGGYGLGLKYVQMVLLAHKGWVEAKSDINSGSRFIIVLPYRKTWVGLRRWRWIK